jgi:hypothetical protein
MKRKKHHGWIRGHKVQGKTYYYYCRTGQRDGAGNYPVIEEYLGSAEKIQSAVKNVHIKGKK